VNFLDRYKVFRRLSLIWVLCLITWTTYRVFTSPPDIPTGTATVFGTVIGMLATVVGFYKWERFKEDGNRGR